MPLHEGKGFNISLLGGNKHSVHNIPQSLLLNESESQGQGSVTKTNKSQVTEEVM